MILKGQFKSRILLGASLIAAAILAAIVVVPQWLSRQARLEVLRSHVGQVAQLAASTIDGDLHRKLIEGGYDADLYGRTMQPLVRFHSAYPDIFYVYTMVDRGGETFFILDTAASPNLRTHHHLRASTFMERFQLRKEYESDWLQQLAVGKTWINPDFQIDDYGTFLSAHAPIYDSGGRYSGFVGVDFDLQYYLAHEARFRSIGIGSFITAMLASVLIGYLVARYHFNLHHQMEKHYYTSLRDDLTGLLNRRGALDAIRKSLARSAQSYAALLIDIDDLKRVNDTHGHAAGDALITHVTETIRRSIREGDECARLGGDEFIIFASDCDAACAAELATRIITRVAAPEKPLPSPVTSVSIGIAVQDPSGASFDRLYRQADAALYRGKSQGKQRFTLFDPLFET